MPKMAKSDVCFLFNRGRCTYQVCKFRHMCSTSAGRHPEYACPRKVDRVPVASLPGNPSGVQYSKLRVSLMRPQGWGRRDCIYLVSYPCMFIHDRYPVHSEGGKKGRGGEGAVAGVHYSTQTGWV